MENKPHNKLPEGIIWKALSHEPQRRPPGWYLAFALISLGLIIFGLYSHSILTVVTFCVIIFSVLLLGNLQPSAVTYKATKTGIALGNTIYPYKIIKTFWIVYNPPEVKTLNFETTAYFNNQLTLQLGNQNPMELKRFLNQYLQEDLNREESVTDTLARRLKI